MGHSRATHQLGQWPSRCLLVLTMPRTHYPLTPRLREFTPPGMQAPPPPSAPEATPLSDDPNSETLSSHRGECLELTQTGRLAEGDSYIFVHGCVLSSTYYVQGKVTTEHSRNCTGFGDTWKAGSEFELSNPPSLWNPPSLIPYFLIYKWVV